MSGPAPETPADGGGGMREAFQAATGLELSDAGEAMLRRFGEAAGIKGNDALWLILYGFEMYRNLYADIPRQVGEAASLTVREQAEAITAHAERVRGAMHAAMADKAAELMQRTIAQLSEELRKGAARKIIEEQAREAITGPVQDAAGKLERLAAAAHGATDRYQAAHTGIGAWISLATVGVIAGLVAAAAVLFLR